jgi:hypothetical protein
MVQGEPSGALELMERHLRSFAVVIGVLIFVMYPGLALTQPTADRVKWSETNGFVMRGGLEAFWNVGDGSKGENLKAAVAHGFTPITLINTYADYPGGQKDNITKFLGKDCKNPWNKPDFFERIIRRNIDEQPTSGTFVHDIEINFDENAQKAWSDPAIKTASGANDFAKFEDAYFREWATWFSLPAKWTKEKYPRSMTGLYGPQPFRRDYYGLAGKSAAQIDGSHSIDLRLWKYIDPSVDFYVSSIYVFYDQPDSIFYLAANVEENYVRTRPYSKKPVYAYEWLRFHDSNRLLRGLELPPYLAEALAVVPFFSGARGVVLWGYEPQIKSGEKPPYQTLPLYIDALARIGGLSEKIGRAKLVIDEPAHVLWNSKRPLIRRFELGDEECIALALNPWQADNRSSVAEIPCEGKVYRIPMKGRHATLADISDGHIIFH